MKPSVGRIVHFTANGAPCMAAIITDVREELDGSPVSLEAFYPPFAIRLPAGMLTAVKQDEEQSSHVNCTWHWPARVEG